MPAFKPVTLFFCYAPEDEPLRSELDKHLTLLERQGYLSSWSGRSIGAGADWRAEVERRMAEARVILLLVSADFLASDHLYEVELKRALKRRVQGATVLGVLLRPSDWEHGDELRSVKMLPTREGDGQVVPVTEWASHDAAFKRVAEAVRGCLKDWSGTSRISVNPLGAGAVRASQMEAQHLPPVWNVPLAQNLNFTGRADELDRLRQSFTRRAPKTPIQAIHGLGGIGKTQLALAYAYRFAAQYEVVWWLRADEPATLAADLADLAVELQLPGSVEPDQHAAVEAVRQRLGREGRWLLIFDSVRDPEDVIRYLPGGMGHVLITSRHPNWSTLALPLPLRGLKRSESVDLLLAPQGAGADAKAAPRNVVAARDLAAELGDLPLALAQAGAYIEETGISVAEYLTRFREHRAELMRRGGQGNDRTVATTWSIAFRDAQQRSRAAGELLDLCAFLAPDDIPRNALALGVAGFPPALAEAVADPFALDEAVKALRRYSLIEVHDDALSVHRLVQAAVRDRLDEGERRAWAERAVAFVSNVFPEAPDDPEQRSACRRWLPHARAALMNARAAAVPPGEPAELLLRHAARYQHDFGFDNHAREMLDHALVIAEAIHGPAHAHVAMVLTGLGPVLMNNGDLEGAERASRRALKIDEANLGPRSFIVATDANNLAAVLKECNALDEARRLAVRALKIDEALGPSNLAAVARDANTLGIILREQEDLEGARRLFERAIAIDEQRKSDDLAPRLNNLGLLLREMKELDEAQRLSERALAIGVARYGRDDPNVATFHSNLASVLHERSAPLPRGDERDELLGAARTHLERALEIGEHIYGEDHYVVAIRRNNLGLLLMDLGNLPEARDQLDRAVQIARRALGPEHRRVRKLQNNLEVIEKHLLLKARKAPPSAR